MSEQTNNFIALQRNQFTLLLIGMVITIAAAMAFAAVFVNNLVQGQVASALAAQSKQTTQTARATTPASATLAAGEALTFETPSTPVCPTPVEQQTVVTQQGRGASAVAAPVKTAAAPVKSKKIVHQKQQPRIVKETKTNNSYNTNSFNTYTNNYSKVNNVKNINSNNKYTDSFNQGSYNEVKGNLVQNGSNNNDSKVDATIINKGDDKKHHEYNDKKDSYDKSYDYNKNDTYKKDTADQQSTAVL